MASRELANRISHSELEIINERPYVWLVCVEYVDFGAAHRTEGDRPGINDKGLVTHDRKIKKDAYYFYRANWNPEPMIYIAGRRNVNRVKPLVDCTGFFECRRSDIDRE